MLGALSKDPSLGGLLGLVDDLFSASIDGKASDATLDQAAEFLQAFADTLNAWRTGSSRELDWRGLISVDDAGGEVRETVEFFVLPVVNYDSMDPAGPAIAKLRALAQSVEELADGTVRMRLTGVPVLAHEDGQYIGPQAGVAGAVSFVLVALVLWFALRSRAMLGALLFTLLVSLCIALGGATLFVGHLNLISIAFGVLCIGLGVDFGIHFCLRCRESALGSTSTADVLHAASAELRRPLCLCMVTTSIAFLAFLPTDFVGMAELGVITACGLVASFLATLTVLPAALMWLFPDELPKGNARSAPLEWLARWIAAQPKWALVAMALLTLGAMFPAAQMRFDADPLAVRDPEAESVQLMRALLAGQDGSPWGMNVLVADEAQARAIGERLVALPSVRDVRTSSAVLPVEQDLALDLIDETALAVLPSLTPGARIPHDVDALRGALEQLRERTTALAKLKPGMPPVTALSRALSELSDPRIERLSAADFSTLETQLMRGFLPTTQYLGELLEPDEVTAATLPESLRRLVLADDGRHRVEVFPARALEDLPVLEEFVNAVLGVDPDAYGEALTISQVSGVVLRAFAFAFAVGAIAIVLVGLGSLRSVGATLTIVVPIAVACVLTIGACKVLGVSLNFANVIVLPLLLGIGIDTAIHLVHRARSGDAAALLSTGTARAAFFSGLTTLVSFGTMAFVRHEGLASLGAMLWVGVLAVLIANFVIIPAWLALPIRSSAK